MTPKVDTINFAYFVPGVVFLFVVLLVLVNLPPENTLQNFRDANTIILNSAVFLAFAYVAGYAMWALAGIPSILLFNHVFCQRIFMHVCQEPLRTNYLSILSKAGYDRVSNVVREPKSFSWFMWPAWIGKTYNVGRALHMFIWDELYNRNNPYHIGRYLSDWNNLKFAKAMACSFFAGAMLFAFTPPLLDALGIEIDAKDSFFYHGSIVYAVLGLGYILITFWRIDVCAMDLAHGLSPSFVNEAIEARGRARGQRRIRCPEPPQRIKRGKTGRPRRATCE